MLPILTSARSLVKKQYVVGEKENLHIKSEPALSPIMDTINVILDCTKRGARLFTVKCLKP